MQVFLVDDLADIIFHRLDPLFRLLDSQARGRPHVHLERARIDLGEELLAQHRPEDQDSDRQQAIGDGNRQDPVPQDEVEPLDVVFNAGIDHSLPAVEGSGDDVAPGLMAIAIDLECLGLSGAFRDFLTRAMRMTALSGVVARVRLEPVGRTGRNEGSRKEVGGDHRERHGHRHRLEEELPQSGGQDQGREHQERAQRRDQLRHGHLAGPQEGCLPRSHTHPQVPVGVFQADDGAINHRPDRQRHAGQGHRVDGLAREVERGAAGKA